jgi:hypothetical protein
VDEERDVEGFGGRVERREGIERGRKAYIECNELSLLPVRLRSPTSSRGAPGICLNTLEWW